VFFMGSRLEDSIAKAKKMARDQNDSRAMDLANELLSQHPDDMRVWMLRGYLHELNEEYEQAKTDLTQAIGMNSLEPHLYYSRGRFSYQLGELHEAVHDFSKALSLCDFHKNDYYRDELLFWRAATLLKLGDKQGSLDDLSKLPEDFTSCTDHPQTKQDLIAACR
jgi:tetratricopeptide (TPR) repeat protein